MKTFQPNFETLETRDVMSVTALPMTGGVLRIDSDNNADTIRVREVGNKIVINNSTAFSNVKSLLIYGNGGGDVIDATGVKVPVVVHGGRGNDYIVGGNGNDFLYGNEDHDVIFGAGGNDKIHGDSGDDRLFGQSGYDYLFGESGNDFLDDGLRGGNEYYDSGADADFIADSWAVSGCKVTDIVQGMSGTCQYLAGLAAGCKAGIDYSKWIVYQGPDASGMGQYDVKLWSTTSKQFYWTRVSFGGNPSPYDALTAVHAADRVQEFEFWPLLMQRAYVSRVNSTNFATGIATATGGNATYFSTNAANTKTNLLLALNSSRPITTAIDHNTLYGITDHALAIVGWRGSASNPELQIYNPWGRDGRSGPSSTYAIEGGNDGLFWVSWNTFVTYFDGGIYIR